MKYNATISNTPPIAPDCQLFLSRLCINKTVATKTQTGIRSDAWKKFIPKIIETGRSASDGLVVPYIHPGSKLGVLLEVNCETDFVARTEAFQEFCKDVAMHIAATSPVSVRREDLDEDIVETEKRIFREQSKKSGKPDEIIEKMIDGRMNKFFQENILIEQSFVKNPDISISDLLTETIAKLGENISIARFTRFQLGETAPKTESTDSE